MEIISESVAGAKSGAVKAITLGGLVVGILDITAASVNVWLRSGRSPVWTFQSVAGGLYGAETFNGGYRTAALGLAIHFFIAITATAVYYLASRHVRFLVNQAILSAVLYGIAVYVFMYFVVIPLTPLGTPKPSFSSMATAILIHIFCVGLPIALIVRRFSR